MQKFAASTPFSQQDVLGYAQQFYSFADAAGLAKDQVIPFLTTVGNVGAVTGASTEGIHNAVMALGQMAGAGKISLDNLNQISDAFPGFNAAAAIAAGTGQSTAEVMDQISKGTLDAKTGIAALIKGMQDFQGASGAMAAQANTLNGLFSTFKDTFSIAVTQAFQPLIPTVKKTLDQLTPVIQQSLDTVAPLVVNLLQSLAPTIGPVISSLTQALVPVLQSMAQAFAQLAPTLPAIAQAFGQLLQGVVPLVNVFAGIASQLGPLISLFSSVAPGILPALAAMKLFSGAITAATRALAALGATKALAGLQGSMSSIRAGAGFAAAGLGLIALAWQQNSQRAAEAKAQAQEYFAALQQSSGLIDDQIKKMVIQKLATQGVYDAAKKYGLSLEDVTKAALGNQDAMQRLAKAAQGNGRAFFDVVIPIQRQNVALQTASRQYQEAASQMGGLTSAAQTAASAMGTLAAKVLGIPVGATRDLADNLGAAAVNLINIGAVNLQGLIDQLGTAAGIALGLANNLGAAGAATLGLNRDIGAVSGLGDLGSSIGALGAGGNLGIGASIGSTLTDAFKPKGSDKPPFDQSTLLGFLQTATGAQTNPLTSALNAIFASAKAAGKKLSDGLVKSLRGQNAELIGLTKQRDKIAEDLQKAQQKLADLRTEVATVRQTTRGTFDVTNTDTLFHEPLTITTILRRVRDAAKNAIRFKALLAKLSREGLAPSLIQQLAEAGPAAIDAARALAAATPKQLRQVNSAYKDLGRAGTGIGNIAADQMFDGGVKAAQGLVDGLRSQRSALNDAIRDLARSMVATLKSTLGIHSPSRVTRGIGQFMGSGLALGIADMHQAVAREGERLANSAVSTAQFGASGGGRFGAARGGDVFITQNNYHPMAVPTAPVNAQRMRAATQALGR